MSVDRARQDVLTELLRDVREDEATLPVLSTAPFTESGRLWINGERITYTGTTPDTFTGCTRGADQDEGGTEARPHNGGQYVWQDNRPSIAVPVGFATFGPFSFYNIPGTATTGLYTAFWTGQTTFDITGDAGNIVMPRAGKVIAGVIASNAARTAGSAKLRVFVNGVQDTTIDYATLDAASTFQHAAYSDVGTPFGAINVVGVGVVTTGWTPTTADMWAYFTVQWE